MFLKFCLSKHFGARECFRSASLNAASPMQRLQDGLWTRFGDAEPGARGAFGVAVVPTGLMLSTTNDSSSIQGVGFHGLRPQSRPCCRE